MRQVLNYKINHWNFQHLLGLLLLTIVCYWPLTFEIFSAKNDNITQFLPVRFHVSEALRAGHLPLWSPYMYLGYPIHGDMQGGAWNPVVWILSIFGRYNVSSLHWEILISIFIAGAGMYRLLGIKNISPVLQLAGASAYIMCGYITDVAGSNLPFLWAAAYIPFVLAYFYEAVTGGGLGYGIKTGIALSLLFVSAYPSFFILTIYVLAAAFIFVIVRRILAKDYKSLKQILIANTVMTACFLGLSAAAIFSYLHVLPFYARGAGVPLSDAMINSFHPSCSLSFVFPSAPIKNPSSFETDLISRNSYFNIFLLLFGCCYIWIRKTPLIIFSLAGMIFFYLFSLGHFTPVREWSYQLLPLMDTFRHPSNARLFVIISAMVIAVIAIQHVDHQKQFPKYVWVTAVAFLIVMIVSAALSFTDADIMARVQILSASDANIRDRLKIFFDSLSLPDVLVVNALIQSIFLFALMLQRRRFSLRLLAVLIVMNSFLFSQLTIPYTLVSKVSPDNLNSLLDRYPNGFPIPDKNSSIGSNSSDVLDDLYLIGITGFYNKKITLTDVAYTPTFMTSIEKAMKDSSVRQKVLSKPYAYLDGVGNFELKKFSNNNLEFETATADSTVFHLQQLLLPGWKCFIDGKQTKIERANAAFMAVNLPEGNHKLRLVYNPSGLIVCLLLSFLSLIGIIFLLLKKTGKKNA